MARSQSWVQGLPPLLGRALGRPNVQRKMSCIEKNANKKKVRCKWCGNFEHFTKTCTLDMVGEDGETTTKKKRLALLSLIFCACILNFYFD
jgi:hypothetical protein